MDDKDLAARCKAEGKCIPLRYPSHRKGQKDYVMLTKLLEPGYPLVTTDRRIVEQNPDSITNNNGGIIVVNLDPPVRTMTTRIAAHMIGEFKKRFDPWFQVDWSRIYMRLTQTEVYIAPLTERPDISVGAAVRLDEPEFEKKIRGLLSLFGATKALPNRDQNS